MGKRIIVIGGGAAGLMAAGIAGQKGHSVTVIETNARPARKVMITGKGRCNVTNDTDLNGLINAVNKNGKFLYSAFSAFSAQDVKDFFEKRGVPLKTERGNRVFPQSDKSVDIVDALVSFARENAEIVTARATEILVENGAVTAVKTEDDTYECDGVILATGGLSYPTTGSTGDGYKIAAALGHTVTPLRPSLVGVECFEGFTTALQGLSLKNIGLKVYKNGGKKPIYTDFGELLFTHFGVSGPTILSASAKLSDPEKSTYTLHIDLKPALSADELDARIRRDFSEFINKDFQNSLDALLPKKLISVIVALSGIPAHQKVNQISREQREKLVSLLKDLKLTVTALRPIEEAVITAGGISLSEVDPKTMQSRIVKGLAFAGEILDLDACTGGFNLQIAFSTGFVAGNSI
ncbi:MAG: NAD(P)/FAD-dependent oxidoreductase [Clostridia bacterium]|nr:NAD(P)/FAD-dependent oxidoreductase [Clostridia bacterium]